MQVTGLLEISSCLDCKLLGTENVSAISVQTRITVKARSTVVLLHPTSLFPCSPLLTITQNILNNKCKCNSDRVFSFSVVICIIVGFTGSI